MTDPLNYLPLDVPQTEEARTEALELMSVKHNLVTPRNGEPVIAAIQDFITASYLMTRKDTFFDRRQFTQICCYFADADLQIDIPPPTIWKPIRLWTGKQIFNVLMRPNKQSNVFVNVECKCNKPEKLNPEHYPFIKDPAPDLSPNDAWLVIVNSEVMCGVMDKAIVGSGKKKSIFGIIMRDYGPHEAAAAMNRVAKLCARWLGEFYRLLGAFRNLILVQQTLGFLSESTTLFLGLSWRRGKTKWLRLRTPSV
jgi:DNA-directed RNA polymerase III subunit RPC1